MSALLGINIFTIPDGVSPAYVEFLKTHMCGPTGGFTMLFMGVSADDPTKVYIAAWVESKEKHDAYFGSDEIKKLRAEAIGTSTFSQNVIWLNASEAITNFPSAFVSDDAYYVLTRSALAKPWGQLRSNVLTKAKAIYIENEATLVLAGVLSEDDAAMVSIVAFPSKAAFEEYSSEEMVKMRSEFGTVATESEYTPLVATLVNYPKPVAINPPKTFITVITSPLTKPFAFYRQACTTAMETKRFSDDLAKSVGAASPDIRRFFAETGQGCIFAGVDAADSTKGVFVITYGTKENFDKMEEKTEENVAARKESWGIDLSGHVYALIANETAVVNWPSIATAEGVFVLGTYTLLVPASTAMKIIKKRLVGLLMKTGVTMAVGGTAASDDSKLYILWHAKSKEGLEAYQADPARIAAVSECIDTGSVSLLPLASVPPVVGLPSALYIPPKM